LVFLYANSVNHMAENEIYEAEEKQNKVADVREGLILAGIAEIEEHGPHDFSLRRVASACGVSCAAPYKHFKSKEDLIGAIVTYIDEKWSLLEHHILTVFPARDEECLTELCLAGVRFWIGNPHFYAVRMQSRLSESGVFREKTSVGSAAEEILAELCRARALSEEEHAELLFAVRSLVTGAILMLEDEVLKNEPATFRMLKRSLKKQLSF